jgi:tetratricopeptide (TPR) repeat protein
MICSTCQTPIPEAGHLCPTCGKITPIDDDATQFIEPGSEDETQLLSPEAGWSQATATQRARQPSASLDPGAILGGRYEILQPLGEGGMGAVLKARDREVDRIVALKVIRSELMGSSEILRRFRQELVLARQVTHRNVVRIFDIGVADGVRFITMEFIEGRELAEVVQGRGKLPPREAAEIMLQVCRGLAAAHAEGVVHRDLKPQNIMIDRQGRVAIMDFGIANSVLVMEAAPDASFGEPGGDSSDLTRLGALLGTPRYMSPQQAACEKADHRSDLFTVGLIFYELLTGDVPCPGKTLEELLRHRATEPIPPLARAEPAIPEKLSRTVDRCLALDPAQRYQSADDIVHDLEMFLGIRRRAPGKLQRAAVAGLATILLVAGGLGYFKAGPKPQLTRPPLKILVADFANASGNRVFDAALEPIIGNALEDASFITTYNRGQAHKIAQQLSRSPVLNEAAARLVAAREGVGVIVSGSLLHSNGAYNLSIRAVNAGDGKLITARSAKARTPEEVPRIALQLTAGVRKALGDVTREGAQAGAAETFSSRSLEAAQQYGRAQELQWQGKWNEAIEAYRQSVQLDPDLGRAYAGLAATLANRGQRQESEAMYKLAMSKIDRMSDREKYRTRGGYYLLERNFAKATEQFSALVKEYPSDSAGIANLALAYFYQRNMTAALEEGRRAVAIYPNNLLQLNNVGLFAMYAGDFETAVQESRRLLTMNSGFEKAYVCLALAFLGQGKIAEAQDAYTKLAALSASGASEAALGLADIAWYQGRWSEAIAGLEKSVQSDAAANNVDGAGMKWAALAQLWSLEKQPGKAVAAAEHAVAARKDENAVYPAALTYLTAGAPERALGLASVLSRSFEAQPQAYAKLIEAEVRLKQGNYRDAVKGFQDAQGLADTWLGRFGLGRAYLAAKAFTEADTEFDACLKRRGEATAVFLDDEPSYHYLPAVYYFLGQAREGLQSPGALEAYQAFLKMKEKAAGDPMVEDARRRVSVLEKASANTR